MSAIFTLGQESTGMVTLVKSKKTNHHPGNTFHAPKNIKAKYQLSKRDQIKILTKKSLSLSQMHSKIVLMDHLRMVTKPSDSMQ